MKSIIVYYSMEGNTKYVAEKIAEETGADLLQLESEKAYPTGAATKYIFGGRSAIMGDKPALKKYQVNLDSYEQVIFGTPVWASTFVPPLRSFIQQENLQGKKIALFACSAGGNAAKCFAKLKQELQIENEVPELSLQDPKKQKTQENDSKINEFCSKL